MLYRELSRLSPDVFFHPVWSYFYRAHLRFNQSLVNELLEQAEGLISEGDMLAACQVLFVCMALLKNLHNYEAALLIAQKIVSMAKIYNLPEVADCAAWSCCALCLLQGEVDTASGHLRWLQSDLKERGYWVLAGVMEILQSSLANSPRENGNTGMVLDWLNRWGEPPPLIETSQTTPYKLYDGKGFSILPLEKTSNGTMLPSATGSYVGSQNGSPNGNHNKDHSSKSPVSRSRSIWGVIKKIAAGKMHFKWVLYEDPISNEVEAPPVPIKLLLPQNSTPNPTYFNSTPSSAELLPLAKVNEIIDKPPFPKAESIDKITEETGTSEPLPIQTPTNPPVEFSSPERQLKIYFLGSFRIVFNEQVMDNWPGRKGQLLFKYLVLNHRTPISRDILMDIFWPDADPEAARNNLNVSLHGLRQALRSVTELPIVLFENGAYRLNPDLKIWTDVEEFERHIDGGHRCEMVGQLTTALQEYELAAKLYQGDFLAEDPYEDWPVMTRERLRVGYLDLLDRLSHIYFDQAQYTACVTLCQQMLERDHCREDAHCLLMRCYSRQGQHYLAMHQYQTCLEALRSELDVDPEPATAQLADRIRRHEPV